MSPGRSIGTGGGCAVRTISEVGADARLARLRRTQLQVGPVGKRRVIAPLDRVGWLRELPLWRGLIPASNSCGTVAPGPRMGWTNAVRGGMKMAAKADPRGARWPDGVANCWRKSAAKRGLDEISPAGNCRRSQAVLGSRKNRRLYGCSLMSRANRIGSGLRGTP